MALSSSWSAFRVDDVARGLDHQRTQSQTSYGTWVANSSTTFEAGMLVMLNASGEVVIPIKDIPQPRNTFDSLRVEKRGPSIVINDPPLWVVPPASFTAVKVCLDRSLQNGSATFT